VDGGRRLKEDPNWPRASAWLAGDHHPDPRATLAVIGAPLRLGSLSGGRFDQAPVAIREALTRYSTWDGAAGRGIGTDIRDVAAADLGDVDISDRSPEDALDPLSTAVREAIAEKDAVALLGGDNSITRPGVHGLGVDLGRVGVITLDAHFDLRDTEDGLSNGNPIRALIEDGLPGRNIWQIGINSFANSPQYADVAQASAIRFVLSTEALLEGVDRFVRRALQDLDERVDAIYVDIDLDVMDRSFAPACPGARPGGLTPWEVQWAARLLGAHPKVRAMDIVELDPTQDVADVTVLTAASCLLSFASGLVGRLT
jgi:formiminoglutamase